jgi:hypothetical protein
MAIKNNAKVYYSMLFNIEKHSKDLPATIWQ